MPPSGSITIWLDRLRERDDSAAITAIWQQFATRVLGLARSKLRNRSTRIADEDDVTNAVFHALFTGVVNGDFPDLNNRDDLWALLIRLTEHKAIDLIRYEGRKKRSAAPEQAGGFTTDPSPCSQDGLANLEDSRPPPDEEVQFAEECSMLLAQLEDPVLIAIAQLKLEGHTNATISELVSRPLRTVERKVALIRSIWSQTDEEDAAR